MENDSKENDFPVFSSKSSLASFAKIVEKLSGDKPNLKVIIKDVKLNTGKAKIELNGEVDFNILLAETEPNQVPSAGA